MKILIDARLYGLENTGLGRYVMNLVNELVKTESDNEYVILLRRKYFNQLNFSKKWKKVLADFQHYSFAEQIKLPLIIKKEKPDLVHFPHFNVPILYNGPYIVTIHDLLMHYQKGLEATTLYPLSYLFKRLIYKFVFNTAIQKSKKIIVPSCFVKNEIINLYKVSPQKINVIYEGGNQLSISNNEKEILAKYKLNSDYFLYVGNAYPHKNLKKAIEAIVLFNQKNNKKIIFAISCARNIFIKRLEKLIEKLEAEKEVKLLGFVPDHELGTLYKNSVALFFPSLSEGFGLPGIEALKAGTISLLSDIPVHKEIFEDVAVYFNPRDVNLIEKSLEKVANLKSTERIKIIEKGKEFVKKYSWHKMTQEILKIYESCLSLRSGQ